MWAMPDTFMAETDECAAGTSTQISNVEAWDADMDTDWELDQVKRDKLYEEMVSRGSLERTQQSIEAYKRDLPQLLRDQKERYVVAYDGDRQLGIASSRAKLLAELRNNGVSDYNGLFIKVVSSLENNRESMSSYNQK
jgi:hypothetical protein